MIIFYDLSLLRWLHISSNQLIFRVRVCAFVQKLPAISTRDHCGPHKLLSSQALLRNIDVKELTWIITIFYDSQMWLADNKHMVVRALGRTGSPLDNVTIFLLRSIYCPGRYTDGQKPTVAHKPVNPTWYIMQRRKAKSPFIYSSPKKSDANSTIFNLFGEKINHQVSINRL